MPAPAAAIPTPPAEAAATPRERRLQAQAAARRDHILAVARDTFVELGLEGASLREIARRAGYTAGALYSYFPCKEDVYAALLADSLERLNAAVAAALPADAAADPPAALRCAARAFFDFYRAHPRDLDLGFYLFQGLQPRGLTPAWNTRLNARLRDALRPPEAALRALGRPPGEAVAEVTALFAHAVGLLLLSHTGRIRMFGQASDALFDRYVDALLARAAVPPAVAVPARPGRVRRKASP